ncbi:hypothetical protein AMELA_G00043580 [Ameiurus melas]|uniref:Uncharacterized protein n=1 Tax=Ameiurus melas TaxID=219545 RepID=A0A7J6B4C0_AMEME|nr:hypothetical protein AMELA_G00043580 [Ameiurus melas]
MLLKALALPHEHSALCGCPRWRTRRSGPAASKPCQDHMALHVTVLQTHRRHVECPLPRAPSLLGPVPGSPLACRKRAIPKTTSYRLFHFLIRPFLCMRTILVLAGLPSEMKGTAGIPFSWYGLFQGQYVSYP